MAIHKTKAKNCFFQLKNSIYDNQILSLEAIALLGFLVGLPSTWNIKMSWLQGKFKNCGRDKLRKIVKELEDEDFIVRHAKQDAETKRMIGVEWHVFADGNAQKELSKMQKTQTTERAVYGGSGEHYKETNKKKTLKSSSSNNSAHRIKNSDRTTAQKDKFFVAVIEALKEILVRGRQNLNLKLQCYAELKIEEYINKYPANTSKADCCMYVIQAINKTNLTGTQK